MPQDKRWLPALDDQPGPARSISDARASAMVDAALDGAFAPPARRRVARLTRITFAIAATLVAAAAAAGTLAWTHRHAAPARPTEPPAATFVPPPVAPAPPSDPTSLPTETPAPAASVSASLHVPHAPPADLADLLAHANDLRAARRWRDAALAYERVASARPSSPEAYAAQVAAADLRLEQLGDPAGALRLYRGSRKGGGRLDEQVLWGIARSTRALGDSRAEGTALREYLSRYPTGLFAPDARQRSSELGQSP